MKFPHHQAFTCLEICNNLCLVHSLLVMPCMPRSGLVLLVSLWDTGVCKLNLSWSNYTSNVVLNQVTSSVKQGIADALVSKSSEDCKAFRCLMMPRCLKVSLLYSLFVKCVIECIYLYGLVYKRKIMLRRFAVLNTAGRYLCCLKT